MGAMASEVHGFHAQEALLPQGWASDVDLLIRRDGSLAEVRSSVSDSDLERLEGPVIPGMPNAHSHAFQRMLLGRTQELAGEDDFWSWRRAMYRLVEAIEPEDLSPITAWVFAQMLEGGYTSVAEFHYLFHDPDGTPYADPLELPRRVVHAAHDAGIGLTLVPVLYSRPGFDGGPLAGGARRFGLSLDAYGRLVEDLASELATSAVGVGIGAHSLRAAGPGEILELVSWASSEPSRPVHIHAAEQPAEVAGCVRATGLRPVEWLLEKARVGPAWTVVHATHMDDSERRRLASSGAVVAVCPTTEADLGDGIFPWAEWLGAGGRFGIGSDLNARLSPGAELRLPAYVSRLAAGRRGALPLAEDRPVGAQLWERAARGGALALGQHVGELTADARADFLVLDSRRPEFQGLTPDRMLDAFVFSGNRRSLARTVVAGRTVARSGRHVDSDRLESAARDAFRAVAGRFS